MYFFFAHAKPTFGIQILELSVYQRSVFSIQMYILKFPSFSNPLSFQGMISRILMYADNRTNFDVSLMQIGLR
jgi:hypothetical protein